MRINDRVFSKLFGFGTITEINTTYKESIGIEVSLITVLFENDEKERCFSTDDKYNMYSDVYPVTGNIKLSRDLTFRDLENISESDLTYDGKYITYPDAENNELLCETLYYISVEFEHSLTSIDDQKLLRKHHILIKNSYREKFYSYYNSRTSTYFMIEDLYHYVLEGTKQNLSKYLAELSEMSVDSEEILSIMKKSWSY